MSYSYCSVFRGVCRYALLVSALWWAAGCSNTETVTEADSAGRMVEQFERDKKTGKKQGRYRRFGPDGQVLEEAYYVQDVPHGKRTLYYADGKIQSEATLEEGRFNGPYVEYFESGTPMRRGTMLHDAMHGRWTFYYPDGQVKEEVTFAEGTEEGPFKQYHPNGKLAAEGEYRTGINEFGMSNRDTDLKEHGRIKMYNEQGDSTRVLMCHYGICKTVWSASAAPAAQ